MAATYCSDDGRRGDFEPFKISSLFDSTAEHPEWLGEEPEPWRQLVNG